MRLGLRTTSNVVVQGTTFVLQKNNDPRQMLLEAISKDKGVIEVILILQGYNTSINKVAFPW